MQSLDLWLTLKLLYKLQSPYALSILIDSGDVHINGVVFNPLD